MHLTSLQRFDYLVCITHWKFTLVSEMFGSYKLSPRIDGMYLLPRRLWNKLFSRFMESKGLLEKNSPVILLLVNCLKPSLIKLRTIFSLKVLFRDIVVHCLLFSSWKICLVLLGEGKFLPVSFLIWEPATEVHFGNPRTSLLAHFSLVICACQQCSTDFAFPNKMGKWK